jgi:hypothetical protein
MENFKYISKADEKKMSFLKRRVHRLKKYHRGFKAKPDWWGDGVGVRGRNLGFMADPKFQKAIQFAEEGNKEGWVNYGSVPRIHWRIYTCIWAASNALHLEGDLVECGVHTGMLSMALCDYLEFDKQDKKLYLFDTFEGIPTEGLEGDEKKFSEKMNGLYFDVYDLTKRNFARFPNAVLVKGVLPSSLEKAPINKISYLAIDLNNAKYEIETIEALWKKLVTGAMVILDDYALGGHQAQYDAWNEFAKSKGRMIYTCPTGQGILQK